MAATNDRVYSISEIVGTSSTNVEDAIRNAIARARKTLRHLDWFEVKEVRGYLGGDSPERDVEYFQVTLKVGFRLEDPDETP